MIWNIKEGIEIVEVEVQMNVIVLRLERKKGIDGVVKQPSW